MTRKNNSVVLLKRVEKRRHQKRQTRLIGGQNEVEKRAKSASAYQYDSCNLANDPTGR